MGCACRLLLRRGGTNGQQCFRTRDEAHHTEPQELLIRWQPSRRANRGDPGQLNQHLSPARGGSPVVSHAAVDESAPGENERVVRLAARPMEDSSIRSNWRASIAARPLRSEYFWWYHFPRLVLHDPFVVG